jgi:beta-galactosidase
MVKTKSFETWGLSGSVYVLIRWSTPLAKDVQTQFIFHVDGTVELSQCMTGLVLPMVKAGVRLGLSKEFSNVSWYGRGPHEAYIDRKTGQKIGKYTATPETLEHRYMRPQENGNRTDTRSLTITNDKGYGFEISADKTFDFSLREYSQEKLESAKHLYELVKDDYLTLNIDHRQRGVGGDMPGNACLHEPYKLKVGTYQYSVKIKGVK